MILPLGVSIFYSEKSGRADGVNGQGKNLGG